MQKLIISFSIFITMLFGLLIYNKAIPVYADSAVRSADIGSTLSGFVTEENIAFIENEVFNKKIVSHLSDNKIQSLCSFYSCSPDKLKAAMCLKYALSLINNDSYTLKELTQKNDGELIALGYTFYKTYSQTLSEQEKQAILEKYKDYKQ